MSLWQKFKEFDKMMSEPAIAIRIEKTIEMPDREMPDGIQQLIEENIRLKKQLKNKKINAVDAEFKLIE